ncbi:uncharacterized protein STEHIDRAFT_154763 [Stereum hirsutum FP-91666 SS1]|uniref:uncharacterized protein n=1 Tax=Stereum hirsutum (strain FP-91666) TaxID=721885 RepID=UPI0004410633|nr:uncharacterized protein STEHIDRAFT_154763 [Stereum hirsutum FP-91666 SS1]EIM89074.1 hypothetical protein STEHIDRAFT_154763 [Stereum hirsutum FP-91666 SS1]
MSSNIGSGTQSPPLQDNEPMGASSIKGGNAGAVPDREQRGAYFDKADQSSGKEVKNVMETAPTASDAVRNLNEESK